MNTFKISFLLFITFFLINCSNQQKEINNYLPLWYTKTIQNTNQYIYGKAQGFDLKEVKLLALEDMSNKLIVQIQSSILINKKTSSNLYSKEIIQNIKQTSKNIIFSNYKVKKLQNISNTYYVLLEVNREKLFNNYKKEFDILNNTINTKYESSYNHSKFEQINILQSAYDKIDEAKEIIYILKALNNDFLYKDYLEFYEIIQIKVQSLKRNLKISLTNDNKHNLFKNYIAKLLNTNNYIITNKSKLIINIKNITNYSKYYGWNIAKINTNINIIFNKKIISTNIITSVGRSVSSKNSALINASKDFNNKLQELGINKLLFNNYSIK